jgi:hypothetical protein
MNILKEIVYGKEGLAEREHKQHSTIEKFTVDEAPIIGQNVPVDTKVTVKEVTVEQTKPAIATANVATLETKMASTRLEQEDVESALDHIKRDEIREGIQTIASIREPVNKVTVSKEAVIQEHIHPVEKIEVQPVLHRERQQMEVHQVVQPINEREVLPAVIQEKELPAQYIGDFVESDALSKEEYAQGAMKYESTVEVDGVRRIRIVKAPIVEEVIRKTIIEEIQPVIHKETIAPVVIKETLPLYEKIVEAPVIIQEERSQMDMGLKLPEEKNLPLDSETILKLHTHQDDATVLKEKVTVTTVETKTVV